MAGLDTFSDTFEADFKPEDDFATNTDLGSAAAKVNNVLSSADPVPDTIEDAVPEGNTFLDNMMSMGVITQGAKLGGEAFQEGDTPPSDADTYSHEAYFQNDPRQLGLIQPYLDDTTTENSDLVRRQLRDIKDSNEMSTFLRRLKESQDLIAGQNESPWTAAAGQFTGIGLDIAAQVGVGSAIGGPVGSFIGGGRGVVTSTPRLTAAGRLALRGFVEGGIERSVAAAYDPLVTTEDVLQQAGIDAAFAGLLGFALAPAMGFRTSDLAPVVKSPADVADEAIDNTLVGPPTREQSIGAAKTPEEDLIVDGPIEAAPGAGSISRKFPGGKSIVTPLWLRSPKRWLAGIGEDAARLNQTGGKVFYDRMARVMHLGILNKAELKGVRARNVTLEGEMGDLKVNREARKDELIAEHRTAFHDIFGAGGAIKERVLAKLDFGYKLLNQKTYHRMADELAQMRGDKVKAVLKFDSRTLVLNEKVTKLTKRLDALKAKAEPDTDAIAKVQGQIKTTTDLHKKAKDKHRITMEREYTVSEEMPHLDAADQKKLIDHLTKSADKDDAFYQKIGQAEVEAGLLDPKDLIPGYRPQRWNTKAILDDLAEFDHFVRDIIARNPDDAWIRKNFHTYDDKGNKVPFMEENETFADLVKRDPEKADEVLDEWGWAAREHATGVLEKRTAALKAEEARMGSDAADGIEAKLRKEQSLASKRYLAMTAKLKAAELDKASAEVIADINTKIARAEKRFADAERELKILDDARADIAELRAFIARKGTNAQRKAQKKAGIRSDRSVRAEAALEGRARIDEIAKEITGKITSGKSPFGFIDDEFVQGSSRFQRRTLEVGALRNTDRGRKFLNTDADEAMDAYGASTDHLIALKRTFGNEMENYQQLSDEALAGFDEQSRLSADPKERQEIAAQKKEAEKFIENIFNQLTHSNQRTQSDVEKSVSAATAIGTTATAAMSLGFVVISALADVMMVAASGSRLGTGLTNLFDINMRKTLKEIQAIDPEMGILVRGPSVVDQGRIQSLADADNDFDVAGGKMATVRRLTNKAANIEAWASFMQPWNILVRGQFGVANLRQFDVDIGDWAKLNDRQRGFYAKHTIDEGIAKKMKAMLNKASHTLEDGKTRIPDQEVWAREAPELLKRWRVAFKGMGDEAMLSPGVGDRPFMQSHPFGRMVLQFQGFMFTAGDRFIGPMIQSSRGSPEAIGRGLGFLTASLMMGGVVHTAKEYFKGRGDEVMDQWSNPDELHNIFWASLVRSPILAGGGANYVDLLSSKFGDNVNDLLDDMGVPDPIRLKESSSKFEAGRGLWSILGPAAATAAQDVPRIGGALLKGEFLDFGQHLARRAPVANTVLAQYLFRQMKGE